MSKSTFAGSEKTFFTNGGRFSRSLYVGTMTSVFGCIGKAARQVRHARACDKPNISEQAPDFGFWILGFVSHIHPA
jgi:hypothetical protein